MNYLIVSGGQTDCDFAYKVIKNGVPINYHGFQIGAIESNNFDGNLNKVVYVAKIKKKYSNLIDSNSVF